MIGPALLNRLTAAYVGWLDEDDLGQRYVEVCGAEQDAAATSVRVFLEELMRLSSGPGAQFERPTALDHPDSTFMQLLSSPLVTPAGCRGLVESLAHHALCVQAIPRLLFDVSRSPGQREIGWLTPIEMPLQSEAVDRDADARGINDPSDRADLANSLMKVLKARLGKRTMRSFFTVDVASNGYRLWDPRRRAPKDSGTTLARHVIRTPSGDVAIDLMRYPDDEESCVRAYECCAELRKDSASELPDAVAYGMAYCFERQLGLPVGGKSDLMIAADCLADVDLLQVNAFFDQHKDAETLIETGDLAFVWLWERRNGAHPGAGQACLRAALTDLRRRLRRIRTVVVDLKPYQYVVSDGAGMPPALHIEKLEAIDRLQSFVNGLHLEDVVKGHCRYIVNRDGDDPRAVMRALGLLGLAQQRERGLDEL
jgi:hypothetical protein